MDKIKNRIKLFRRSSLATGKVRTQEFRSTHFMNITLNNGKDKHDLPDVSCS